VYRTDKDRVGSYLSGPRIGDPVITGVATTGCEPTSPALALHASVVVHVPSVDYMYS
jgi:hypothetical protein